MNKKPKILFISHDANRAGAQIFLRNIMTYFAKKTWDLHLILLNEGVLKKDFEEISTVYDFPREENFKESKKEKILSKLKLKEGNYQKALEKFRKDINSQHFDWIYANTIACADTMPLLYPLLNAPLISHIHELELSIDMYSTPENRKLFFEKSQKIIACSASVAENLIKNEKISPKKIETIHSFVDNEKVLSLLASSDKMAIKKKYNIPSNTFIIGGCGNVELRKGIDIFLMLANKIKSLANFSISFVWVGLKKEGNLYHLLKSDIKKLDLKNDLILIEPSPDAIELINCFDIFCLTSREDPFPLVMLEAALAQKTIIGMEHSGGVVEFVEDDAGLVCKYMNISTMAKKILELYENEDVMKTLGENAKTKVLKRFNFESSIKKIENLLNQ
jgi:glycosyltransferase involved in cell wall biosynthesis